jgi:hypothetical protein
VCARSWPKARPSSRTRFTSRTYEKIWAAPHTLNPDRLAREPKKPTFETVSEKKVLTDGNHVVELHHRRAAVTTKGMIVAYLPKEKILVEADAFNPPADKNAPVVRRQSLHAQSRRHLRRLKHRCAGGSFRFIPVDNRVVEFAEFTAPSPTPELTEGTSPKAQTQGLGTKEAGRDPETQRRISLSRACALWSVRGLSDAEDESSARTAATPCRPGIGPAWKSLSSLKTKSHDLQRAGTISMS